MYDDGGGGGSKGHRYSAGSATCYFLSLRLGFIIIKFRLILKRIIITIMHCVIICVRQCAGHFFEASPVFPKQCYEGSVTVATHKCGN